jgi:hypothetical protein
MPDIDAKKIEELRGLLAKATPGPWEVRYSPRTTEECIVVGPRPETMGYAPCILAEDYTGFGEWPVREADHLLVAAMRNALPALLDLAERASLPLAGDVEGLWREQWYGSEPQKGSWIFAGREPVAFIGPDATAHALTTAIVMAHNALIRSLAGRVEGAKEPAAADVLAERERQKSSEGWTIEHDDAYHKNELPLAAACYAIYQPPGCDYSQRYLPNWRWPWSLAWWKPTNRRRDLVKVGALILAEIERIDRARAILEPGHEG